jgi:hypothetical protein
MKYLFLLLLFIKFNSCIVDKAVLEDYKINNSTQLDLEFITIEKNSFDTLLIKNNSEIILEQFHFSDQFYPYDLFDSIYVKFSDNKVLKYFKTDDCASGKSFFCSNNTICVEKVCTFEIDSIEYKKAR